jgi:hypothetical protein
VKSGFPRGGLAEHEGRTNGGGEIAEQLDVAAVIERLVREIKGDPARCAGEQGFHPATMRETI